MQFAKQLRRPRCFEISCVSMSVVDLSVSSYCHRDILEI